MPLLRFKGLWVRHVLTNTFGHYKSSLISCVVVAEVDLGS